MIRSSSQQPSKECPEMEQRCTVLQAEIDSLQQKLDNFSASEVGQTYLHQKNQIEQALEQWRALLLQLSPAFFYQVAVDRHNQVFAQNVSRLSQLDDRAALRIQGHMPDTIRQDELSKGFGLIKKGRRLSRHGAKLNDYQSEFTEILKKVFAQMAEYCTWWQVWTLVAWFLFQRLCRVPAAYIVHRYITARIHVLTESAQAVHRGYSQQKHAMRGQLNQLIGQLESLLREKEQSAQENRARVCNAVEQPRPPNKDINSCHANLISPLFEPPSVQPLTPSLAATPLLPNHPPEIQPRQWVVKYYKYRGNTMCLLTKNPFLDKEQAINEMRVLLTEDQIGADPRLIVEKIVHFAQMPDEDRRMHKRVARGRFRGWKSVRLGQYRILINIDEKQLCLHTTVRHRSKAYR